MRLATLLKICDELQDWSRPLHEKPKGYPADFYDINCLEDRIEFKVHHSRYEDIVHGISEIVNFPLSINKIE